MATFLFSRSVTTKFAPTTVVNKSDLIFKHNYFTKMFDNYLTYKRQVGRGQTICGVEFGQLEL